MLSAEAAAHPHMFFDAGVKFDVDASGQLAGLEVGFVVDEYNSLYSLAELDLDGDGDGALTPPETLRLAKAMRSGLAPDGYFVEMSLDGAPTPLAAPTWINAQLTEGRIAAVLRFDFEAPLTLSGRTAEVALYDPTYFTGVAIVSEPAAPGAPTGCAAALDPFQETAELIALQRELADIPADADPEEPKIGRLFADRAVLSCL